MRILSFVVSLGILAADVTSLCVEEESYEDSLLLQMKPASTCDGVPGYQGAPGQWKHGESRQYMNVPDAISCGARCTEVSGCVGFHYRTTNFKCNLFTVLGVEQNLGHTCRYRPAPAVTVEMQPGLAQSE
mmetsp:Transcript_45541/g.120867  ORF Transcript_45541/g.120867 Transcript_45541/m.120867 type:complete len:130 (-) Transcript_45541:157-546(-)|eukprot:CAMPEP_0194481162 /NCGR_PEP_ID=MMETSP0253-20130528/3715_1 /TAXON_ID=2966 /ORGANISM="Noctiluca scintillans" /LENGTH=129 /DNA_ID=CAMNT_0039320629 /DNA_START=56 /DNA_END=445 /DNA_ORIENTATION=+